MTLYDLMMPRFYKQTFHVYVTNVYGQNIPVGHGTRKEICDEEKTEEGLDHLMDRVDFWEVCPDGSVLVLLANENFARKAEELYSPEYVSQWDNLKPETRPWKNSCELENKNR